MANKLIGLFILSVGVLFLLSNTGYIDMNIGQFISTYWPLLIIYIGIKKVFNGLIYFGKKLGDGQWRLDKLFWGLVILAIGIVIQGNKLAFFSISWGQFWNWAWPVLIIYIGLSILLNRGSDLVVVDLSNDYDDDRERAEKRERKNSSNVKQKQLIGDIRLGKTPWYIEDLHTWVGIGDMSVDLTTAMLKEGENTIDLTGIIGDIKILVPENLPIKVNVDVKLGEVKVFNNRQSGTNRYVTYESENFEIAEKKVAIYIKLSIGDVKVKRVD